MAIQWYPGHMHKLKATLKSTLPLVDVVLEVVDARAPISSRNPMLDEILGKKPRIILLNKAELADPNMLHEWQEFFKTKKKYKSLAISAKTRTNLDRIKGEIQQIFKSKEQQRLRNPRALIIGVPNCGKSTIINALAREHRAKAANQPGVTKQVTLYHAQSVDIYDTPGLLWPNLEDQEAAARLAVLAAVRDEVYHPSEAFASVYLFLKSHYADRLIERYKIPLHDNAHDYLIALTTTLNKKDIEATALLLFNDLRGGKLGRFCLERPPYVT
ncbi:ribosome biogenesis GTPase YlqF [Entomospira culicis]|uniref:Ribosome biogenesis GTPase A n=1 Tax=Entomospira culicis TaxID=2719989 RepID=A0A968KYZ2_9SPIO|nr:ribosome biogenesis GTPase YlqF [Entomospira culicis]NIZ18581.1 ribosome biogenesis GTPase YlqF [Entomospira culicis]NIZ68796.1 ribosome biogenesis GTPase YlqF [Entomospira culicis]WDI37392.1 ribosome biogenesis GTPase YlqF [Entomospira culicis]WDI39021.1 ribosome biogenesis GTPase YlqF [Entomospira culicis]